MFTGEFGFGLRYQQLRSNLRLERDDKPSDEVDEDASAEQDGESNGEPDNGGIDVEIFAKATAQSAKHIIFA